MKYHTLYLLPILFLAACSQTKNIPEDEYLYAGIQELAYGHREQKDSLDHQQLLDNEEFSLVRSEVNGALACAPNGSIMGSSYWTHPFTIGLWVWNKYGHSEKGFGRWMMNTLGSTPKYISTVNPKVRAQVARNVLRNHGYFRGDVQFRIDSVKNPRKKKISYQILPGTLFRLGNIEYRSFPLSIDTLISQNHHATLLHTNAPFSVSTLSAERDRLASILRGRGHYYFRADHITYRADTLLTPNQVQLQVLPSATMSRAATVPFHVGKTRVTILKYGTRQYTDSIGRRDFSLRWSGGKKRKPSLRPAAFYRYLYLKKGDLYNQELHNLTQSHLSAMGIFSSVQVNYVPRDSALLHGNYNAGITCDTLDLEIQCTLDKPYDSEFEAKVTNKTNGLLGPALSYSINKRNAFRGAETLTLGVHGSYEWQTGANDQSTGSTLNSWELGGNLSLTYPRFIFFGNLWRKIARTTQASTLIKFDLTWTHRAGYYGNVGTGMRFKWTFHKGSNILHEFTPVRLEFNKLLSTTERFDSLMIANPALGESFSDKLVPSMEYAFTWTTPKVQKHQGRLALYTKQAIQFQKYTAEYSHMLRLTERSQLVLHGYLGFIWNYGNKMAPYSDLFSAGGANSVRAFGVRGIGPGSYHPAQSSYSYLNQVGNMRFECNAEYRFPIIAQLYGALFLDAGNVWLTREDPARPGGVFQWKNLGKELALGTGLGLRYDLEFLVIRFDLGIGIHAPYDTGKPGYYNMPSFGKSLGYHFGVGYPF